MAFPENDDAFFNPTVQRRKRRRYLDEDLVDASNIVKLCVKKDLLEAPAEFTVKKQDGSDFCRITTDDRSVKIFNMRGQLRAVLIHDSRLTEVSGAASDFHLPHVFVYAPEPYEAGAPESDFLENDKPVYYWARIHKASMGKKTKDFVVAFAESAKERLSMERFQAAAFGLRLFHDGRMAFSEAGGDRAGAARAEAASFGFECAGCYSLSVGPCVDPVLMICAMLGVESLGER